MYNKLMAVQAVRTRGCRVTCAFGGAVCVQILAVMDSWADATELLVPWYGALMTGLQISQLLGASYFLALVADLVSLATSHIYIMYTILAAVHRLQVRVVAHMVAYRS